MFKTPKWILKLRGARNFSRLVADPNRLNDVFKLSDSTDLSEVLAKMAERLAQHPRGAEALLDCRRLPPYTLEQLNQKAGGTLGKAFAEHMISRGLKPEAIPVLKAGDPGEFVRAHLYETHDIWHVVSGFDTDVAGELGLQGFYMAQLRSPLPPTLISAGLLNSAFHNLDDGESRMRNIVTGWRLGRLAQPLFGTKWDLYWDSPLEEVRRTHGIDPRGVQPELAAEAEAVAGVSGMQRVG